MLGLAGKPVDEATFHRLCDNRHPTQDKPLTPRTNDHRRVCYDFTISGPKSFSIIEAFAEPEERGRLRQAFDDAVAEMVAEDMEPDMQTRERAKGADHNITTGNILTVSFDHATARPENDDTLPDPHWHKHLLVWNATRRPDDGKIKAGQFGDIVRDKPYYRAAFYSRLADKLEELGYAIDRRGGTEWEIAGVPQTVIDKFSKRTMQIEAEAEKRGITDAAEKAELGAKDPVEQAEGSDAERAADGLGCPARSGGAGRPGQGVRRGDPAGPGGDRLRSGGLGDRPCQRKALGVPRAGNQASRLAPRAGVGHAGPGRGRVAATGRHHLGDRRPADGDHRRAATRGGLPRRPGGGRSRQRGGRRRARGPDPHR